MPFQIARSWSCNCRSMASYANIQTLELSENNFTEGQAKLKDINIGAGHIRVRAQMTDGHYIHHSPLLPWPLMCPRLIFTCCFHIDERWRFGQDRRKTDEINKQRRWRAFPQRLGGGGTRRGGDEEGRELKEDRVSVSRVWSPLIVWGAEILDTLKSPSAGLCGAAKKKQGLRVEGEKKTKEARLLLLPVPLLHFRHFSQFSTAFPLMGSSGAGAHPNRLGARGGLQGVASSL